MDEQARSRIADALASSHEALRELRGPTGSPGWGSFYWAVGGGGYEALRAIEGALDELFDPRGEQLRQAWTPAPKR